MRIIAHIDMDAFFAAVEEHDNPQFRGLPIAVGAEPVGGRGVVSTANYSARAYGIHSALPISRAWRFSENARLAGKPAVVFLPVNFGRYGEVSRQIFEIVGKFVPILEQTSIDEAYLDLSFTDAYEKAIELCREIKSAINDEWSLTASVGIGPNKLIAKIASDFKKPDGLTVVKSSPLNPSSLKSGGCLLYRDSEAASRDKVHYFESVDEFIEPLPIRKIPGIGPKTEAMLARLDVKIVRDLKKYSLEKLRDLLGKWGGELYQKIRGIDDSPLVLEREAKSIGEQETFLSDTLEPVFIFSRLKFLCQSVFSRFGESGFKSFRTIAITVRFADFKTKSRARTLLEPANSPAALEREAMKLLLPFFDGRENSRRKLIRLLGVRLEKLQ